MITEPSTRPSHGQMTAVMRAVARPKGPRVLRAALVRAGKVIDERVLADGAPLTVGPSEQNTFVVPIAASARLIERGPRGYRLCPVPGAGGRVASGAAVRDLEQLGEAFDLADDARGKITVGDSVILFHFVDPPARPPRAQLPLAVQKGAFDGLDWKTTFIAAFSFLAHFGAVGAVYSDWADPVIDEGGVVTGIVDTLKHITTVPPIESATPMPEGEAPSNKPAETTAAKGPPSTGRGGGASPARGGGGGTAGRMSDSRAASIARELESSNENILLAIGAHNSGAIGRVLEKGDDVSLGLLNGIAANAGGVKQGGETGLNLNGNGGIVRPGAGGPRGLPIDGPGPATRTDDVGKRAEGPKLNPRAQIMPPEQTGGSVPDAGRVIGGMRSLFRACYRHALDDDPTMRGTARAVLSIGPAGEVRSVQMSASGLSSTMVSCLKRVVSSAQFGNPENGGATLVVPMSFIPQ